MKNKNSGTFFPKEVSVAASLIINDLYKNNWYENNNIVDPQYSISYINQRVNIKYLENSNKLNYYRSIFTKKEFLRIQDKIVENQIIHMLSKKKMITLHNENKISNIYLTNKGVKCISIIIDNYILSKNNNFDINKPISLKNNIVCWLVEKNFVEAYVDSTKEVLKKTEDILFKFTPKGISNLRYLINPQLIKI